MLKYVFFILLILVFGLPAQAFNTKLSGGSSTDVSSLFEDQCNIGPTTVEEGNYSIGSNVTCTYYVKMLPGAQFTIASSKVMTFNGGFDAPIDHVFSVVSSNQVAFNSEFVSVVYPEWWGAKADGSTDSVLALNSALKAWPNNYDYGLIQLQAGTYNVSGTVVMDQTSNLVLQGTTDLARATNTTTIRSTSMTLTVFKILGSHITGYADNNRAKNVTFSRSSMGSAGSKTIEIIDNLFSRLENVNANKSQYDIHVTGSGIDFYGVNSANEGCISGQTLYGIYIDGSSYNSGYKIKDHNYFSPCDPSISPSYALYDGATAYGAGDRMIDGFWVTGEVNYGLYIVDGGGFSSNLSFKNWSMDAIVNECVHLESPSTAAHQQFNSYGGWCNLTDKGSNNAISMHIIGRANTTISDTTMVCGGTASFQCVVLEGAKSTTLMGNHFTSGGGTVTAAIRLKSDASNVPSDRTSIVGNTTEFNAPILFDASSNSVMVGNTLGSSPITLASGSNNNIINDNSTGTIIDNGSGNKVNSPITLSGDVTNSGSVTTIKTNVALAGSPTTNTQSPLDSSTKIATTAYVDSAVAVGGGGGGSGAFASQTVSGSSVSSVDFTGISTSYDSIRARIIKMKCVTNGAYPVLQVGDGGGYKTSSYNWSSSNLLSNSTTPANSNSTSDSFYAFAGTGGVSSSGFINANVTIYGLGNSSMTKYFGTEKGSFYSGSNDNYFRSGGQYYGGSGSMDRIRIMCNTGNVGVGTLVTLFPE